MRIIHIHNDEKFLSESEFFVHDEIDNHVIFLGERKRNEAFSFQVEIYASSLKSLEAIARFCSGADLVVLYGLDGIKCRLLTLLPDTVKTAWRFFGFELYGRRESDYLSDLTLSALNAGIKQKIRWVKRSIKQWINWNYANERRFLAVIQRINYFIGVCEDEYLHLKEEWRQLPLFLQCPFVAFEDAEVGKSKMQKKVLIGNSSSVWNNHLDVLALIRNAGNGGVDFIIPTSYSHTKLYHAALEAAIAITPGAREKSEFVSLAAYTSLLGGADAFVLNAYRQLALGNISIALVHGVKIYLNRRNVVYHWLRKMGFCVFTMEDFEEDLVTGNVSLDPALKAFNRQLRNGLKERFPIHGFQQKLFSISR